jgi:hypothetical protein
MQQSLQTLVKTSKSEPMSSSRCISKIGWCVGRNTTHLAKLPHFPSFLSLVSARTNFIDVETKRAKLFNKPTKTKKWCIGKNSIFLGGFPLR